ncbi:MAG: hypothetical protein IKZ14_03765 [Muribaculaceae bacterium]|nr:hypothetical protein [Muribaculaceae bacterium]
MSNILIQKSDGSTIQRSISQDEDLATVYDTLINQPGSTATNISITLDTEGTYHLRNQLLAICNFSLIATVPNVVISAGTAGKVFETIAVYDESIIKVMGTPGTPVKAVIKNITFDFIGTNVNRNDNIWAEAGSQAGYYYFKFQDLSKVTIEDISITLNSLKLTNIILDGCSNASIKGCTIKNYHKESIGGNLWIRNSKNNPVVANIEIINNSFFKHGNDEAIGIWTLITEASTVGNTLRNILISGNHIEYARPNDVSVNYTEEFLPNDVLVKIYGERTNVLFDQATGCPDKSSYPSYYEHIMEDIIISNNTFHIKDLVHKVVSFWCDGYLKARNIVAQNNTIIIENIDFPKDNTYNTIGAFAVNDTLGTDLEVTIAYNTILSKCNFNNNTPDVEALQIYGGHTHFKNNIVKTDGIGELIGIGIRNNPGITQSSNNTDSSQTASIRCRNYVKLDLDGNTFENLYLLGSFSYTSIGQHDIIFLNMTDNFISGGTKIYCNNIATMHSVITNNTFNYKNVAYCFQNYAHNGTLRFCNNKTIPQSNYYHRDCCLYKYYGTTEDLSHFDLVTLIDNVFTNINRSTNLSGIPSQSIIEHNNTYTELTQN